MKLFFCVLILSFQALVAQNAESSTEFTAKMSISSPKINLNDSLFVFLTLEYPSKYQPDYRAIKTNLTTYEGNSISPFRLTKMADNQKKIENNGVQENITYELAPQIEGKHYLTFFKIPFYLKENSNEFVYLFSELVEVQVEASPSHFQPENLIAPLMALSKEIPIEIDYANKEKYLKSDKLNQEEKSNNLKLMHSKALPWIYLVALLAMALALITLKYFPAPQKKIDTSKEPPHQRALNQIQILMKDSGECQQVMLKLDGVIRNYIAEQYQINAPVYTTQEFLSKSAHIEKSQKDKLASILSLIDQVKFMDYKPNPEECHKVIKAFQIFLEKNYSGI